MRNLRVVDRRMIPGFTRKPSCDTTMYRGKDNIPSSLLKPKHKVVNGLVKVFEIFTVETAQFNEPLLMHDALIGDFPRLVNPW